MMASASLRCLARPALPVLSQFQLMTINAATFSTTAAVLAIPPPPIRSRRELVKKPIQNMKKKKKSVKAQAKKPNPGERKAFRRRIQLSNDNALLVEGKEILGPNTLTTDNRVGRMVAVPDQMCDQLRALEAFKPTQKWGLFRKPHFLVRTETVELAKRLSEAREKKEVLKCVLTGDKLSGKSVVLLQAMAYALSNEWIVVNIPEGQELTNGNTDYAPVPKTKPMQFSQPVYCLKLLQAMHKANKTLFDSTPLKKDWSSFAHLRENPTIGDLITNVKEIEYGWQLFEAVWTELTQPGLPPILLTIDGLSHVSANSHYRSPSFEIVHAHDLSLVRLFMDLMGGKVTLANGGAVIAATSRNNFSYVPSQELVLSQLEAGQAGQEVPKPDPFERGYDERVYDTLKNSWVLPIKNASVEQTRELLEYWASSGIVKSVLDHQVVAEKWTLGGHGNIGEVERASLATLRM